MLDIAYLRAYPDEAQKIMTKRGAKISVKAVLAADEKWREVLSELETLRAGQNKLSEEIASLKGEEREQAVSKSKQLKTKISEHEETVRAKEEELRALLCQLPNLLMDDVPSGPDASGNKVLRQWGKKPKLDFRPKDHLELGKLLDGIDMERAAKVSGARFGYFKGDIAMLQLALMQFTFSRLTDKAVIKRIADSVEKGYDARPFVPVIPPVMIRPEPFTRMARLSPKDKDERYHMEKDDLYLIGSAEHTLGAMHMDETLPEAAFPLRYLGYSTCFRREAGTYGQDTRGMLRVHQFDKIEMESFTLPENSLKEHEFFIAAQEYLMQALGLPYQVVLICTGDMGDPDARQVDIETWMPSQGRYRETQTADLMTDYQTRRLNIKVRRQKGGVELAHTNDATGIAMGRTIIAILENNQEKDGSVVVPEVLRQYLGGREKFSPRDHDEQ